MNYFNLLSWLDGTTCNCPDCVKERTSGAGEQVFEAFQECFFELLNQPLFIWFAAFCFVLVLINLLLYFME